MSRGYQLDINTGKNSTEAAAKFVKERFADSQLVERHENNIKYCISKHEFSLGELFE